MPIPKRRYKDKIVKKERIRIDKNGCWNWLLAKDRDGYGLMKIHNKGWRAMRWYYEQAGNKLIKGLVLDHKCNNRTCVNPEHLEQVNIKENIRRRKNIKLSVEKAKEIKLLYEKGTKQIQLAELFDINQSNVSRIINNQRWIVV